MSQIRNETEFLINSGSDVVEKYFEKNYIRGHTRRESRRK